MTRNLLKYESRLVPIQSISDRRPAHLRTGVAVVAKQRVLEPSIITPAKFDVSKRRLCKSFNRLGCGWFYFVFLGLQYYFWCVCGNRIRAEQAGPMA